MALTYQVLGNAGRDNALLVTIDNGQHISRLLFDCGANCLDVLPFVDVQAIDHLFFSHLHMDHVAGFDGFFRCTYNRTVKPNHIWGPPRTGAILQHRFQGYMWNLISGQQVTWHVHDLHGDHVETRRYEMAELFGQASDEGRQAYDRAIVQGPTYHVEALLMNHGTPSVAYIVRETPRRNVDTAKLAELGLRPGAWLQRVRGSQATSDETVLVDGVDHSVRKLQDALVTEKPGAAIAYLTDFLLDAATIDTLADRLQGVTTIVCECQYREADRELALRNYHMTTTGAAAVAHRAGASELVLFHLSDRYRPDEWQAMLAEARAIFPAAKFPDHWQGL